jgi:UDP-N-acetylglucosamine 4,6-dehydratase/5-epimerase
LDNHVGKIVSLSTDKAVSPVNLYGTTKLAGEKIVIGSNVYAQGRAQSFSVVRYGNVAGSRGSVIPLFRQLDAPVPVTDSRMTRFWMTLDDAVDIVFKAIDTASGGEVFIPKMKAFKITDLAEALGKTWKEVGIRCGEKLHESMWTVSDSVANIGQHFEVWPKADWFKKEAGALNWTQPYSSDCVDLLSVDELKERLKTV